MYSLLRRMVAGILSSIGPNGASVASSGRRAKRDLSAKAPEPVSSAHRRTRRSLDDLAPPSPSNDPPLLRVKRLEDYDGEEQGEKLHPQVVGLQRMKRIDTTSTGDAEELNHGSRRRRRRAALNYDPQILVDQILEYMREWGVEKRVYVVIQVFICASFSFVPAAFVNIYQVVCCKNEEKCQTDGKG